MPDERGQATPLLLVALLFAGLVCGGLAHLGRVAASEARAQAAADAVALAGALRGEAVAQEVAVANRASVVRYDRHGDDVEVTVTVGAASAEARARWLPAAIP